MAGPPQPRIRPERATAGTSNIPSRLGEAAEAMLTITMQDLRFRARQFLIAVGGAGLIFAMTLLLSGLAAGFRVEVIQTVEGLGAQAWVVGSGSGSAARIISLPPIPGSAAAAVRAE